MRYFRNTSTILVSFCQILWASKEILSLKMLSELSVRCVTFSIMAKKYAAYAFILLGFGL